MLSIANVSANQVLSYYKKDDYYTREAAGQWQGALKKAFGVQDEIVKEEFQTILENSSSPERAGYDLCFSVPKSVSLAMCQKEYYEEILAAHQQAVTVTLEHLEESCIYTRVTKDRVTEKVWTGKMLCGKFDHFVSRNHDPQLHTHCVIANQTLCEDGEYRAIENRKMYEYKMIYGQMYRNELANNLRKLGFKLDIDSEKGFFEIEGVSRPAIEAFSSRRLEILEQLEAWGLNPEAATLNATQLATTLTREAKENKDLNMLMKSWLASLEEQEIHIAKEGAEFLPRHQLIQQKLKEVLKEFSKATFAFTKKEFLLTALREGLDEGVTLLEVENFFEAERNQEIFFLESRNEIPYFCTKAGYQLEKAVFEEIVGSQADNSLTPQKVEAFLAATDQTLNSEQRKAVVHLCTAQDRFVAVQGLAGTGKTYMLNQTRAVLENWGYQVRGICFTGKAAVGLEGETTIASQTIHTFLNQMEKEAGNFNCEENFLEKDSWDFTNLTKSDKPEVWIIDEAGMVNNNLLYHLAKAAHLRDARVIFTGDKWQLAPIGAGNAFRAMIDHCRINYVEMNQLRRQKTEVLKAAVWEAVKGTGGIEEKHLKKKVARQEFDKKKRLTKMAEDLGREYRLDSQVVMLTADARDCRELNYQARNVLKKAKFLTTRGKGKIWLASKNDPKKKREFCVGEKVVFNKDWARKGVQKGDFGVVVAIKKDYLVIRTDEKTINVDFKKENLLDYGYAVVEKEYAKKQKKVLINLDSSQKRLNKEQDYFVEFWNDPAGSAKVYLDHLKAYEYPIKELQEKFSLNDSLAKLEDYTLEINEKEERLTRIAVDFLEQAPAAYYKSLAISKTNADCSYINQKIHAQLKETGFIKDGAQFTVVGNLESPEEKEFCLGERIVFLQNNKNLKVMNGETGIITELDPQKKLLKIKTLENKIVEIDLKKYNRLDYAYALTTHKSQGVTYDNIFINIDSSQVNSRNDYYVDISRVKNNLKLYTDNSEQLKEVINKFSIKLSSYDFKEESLKSVERKIGNNLTKVNINLADFIKNQTLNPEKDQAKNMDFG